MLTAISRIPTMKLNVSILFIAIQLARIFAASVSNNATECGSLGVISTNLLPDGITAADVRTCADHPLGHRRAGVRSLAPMSNADLAVAASNINILASRGTKDACYYNAPYGCSDGYCWKTCGPSGRGQWCWLAANNGYGDWLKCTTYQQCSRGAGFGCGKNCKQGSNACGCSCSNQRLQSSVCL